jgi:hypothetical protein
MPEPTDYDRMMWEALNEDIAHPLTAETPIVAAAPVAPVVLPPLPNSEPAKPQAPEYAPPTVSSPVVSAPSITPNPPAPAEIRPTPVVIEPVQIEDAAIISPEPAAEVSVDFAKLLREPQTSSIVIDREKFPTGAIDLPPIEEVRPKTGQIKAPWLSGVAAPATGVDSREASGTGPIDVIKPVSASVVGSKVTTGIKQRSKRQTTLAFITAGLMMLVGGLFLAAYFLGYLR